MAHDPHGKAGAPHGHDDHDDDAGHHGGGHHEAHEEGEPWLVSYADLMTLLFGFFVLMYTFAQQKLNALNITDNVADLTVVRKEVARYFGGEVLGNPMDKVASKLRATLAGEIAKDVDITVTPEGMEVTFRSGALFALGQSELTPEAKKAVEGFLRILSEEIKGNKHLERVIVEGHTDDIPVATARFPSNWELSGARASTVVRLFEAARFDPGLLVAIGYGSSRPIVPNRDEAGQAIAANQARNRRIVIKVGVKDSIIKESKPVGKDAGLSAKARHGAEP